LKKSLVLTGMMGVGKSTIGNLLSSRIKYDFIDIDVFIEKREKLSVKKIFEIKGENFFRDSERNISLKFLKENNLVIALGGGAFIDPIIRKEVLKYSTSFWLDLSVKNLMKRNFNLKKRPLLSDKNPEDVLNKIYDDRKKIYNLADYKINCNDLSKAIIVEKISEIYENNRNKNKNQRG